MILRRLISAILLAAICLAASTPSQAQTAPVLWRSFWNNDIFIPQKTSFSSDSRYFSIGYDNGFISIFDAGSGILYKNYHLHDRHVFCTVFQPGGNILASGDKEGVMVLYDYVAGKQIMKINAHDKSISAMAFSADGRYLLTGSHDNTIKIWDPATGKQLLRIGNVTGNLHALRLTNDNLTIIAGTAALSKGLRLFDAKTGNELQTFDSPNLKGLDLSPDGRYIATANLKKYVLVYDVQHFQNTGAAFTPSVAKLEGHDKDLTDVVFSPSGKVLYSCSEDRTVIAWDVAHLKQLSTIFESHKKIDAISCAPNGKYLAVLDEGNVLSILDISNIEANMK